MPPSPRPARRELTRERGGRVSKRARFKVLEMAGGMEFTSLEGTSDKGKECGRECSEKAGQGGLNLNGK
jgi:hypothetical protein